jgi:hypothetical protein
MAIFFSSLVHRCKANNKIVPGMERIQVLEVIKIHDPLLIDHLGLFFKSLR